MLAFERSFKGTGDSAVLASSDCLCRLAEAVPCGKWSTYSWAFTVHRTHLSVSSLTRPSRQSLVCYIYNARRGT